MKTMAIHNGKCFYFLFLVPNTFSLLNGERLFLSISVVGRKWREIFSLAILAKQWKCIQLWWHNVRCKITTALKIKIT
jgi:hypothetical protein